MITRPAGHLRLNPAKVKLARIKLVDKDTDHTYRIVFANLIVQPVWKQSGLAPFNALDKTLHQKPPQLTTAEF